MKVFQTICSVLVLVGVSLFYAFTQFTIALADVPVGGDRLNKHWVIASVVLYIALMIYLITGRYRLSKFKYFSFCITLLLCTFYVLINPFDVCTTQFRILSDRELFNNLLEKYYSELSDIDREQLQFKNINQTQKFSTYFTQKRMFDRGIIATITNVNSTETRKQHWYQLNYCGIPIYYIGSE